MTSSYPMLFFKYSRRKVALEGIWHFIEHNFSLSERTGMSMKYIIDLVGICLDGETCEQIVYTLMESLLSDPLSDAVVIKSQAKACKYSRPRLWTRCIESSFMVLIKYKLDEFHRCLRTRVPRFNFTREKECERKVLHPWRFWPWGKLIVA